jgi:hypothetical protein
MRRNTKTKQNRLISINKTPSTLKLPQKKKIQRKNFLPKLLITLDADDTFELE